MSTPAWDRPNFVLGAYRGVSVTEVDCPLDEEALRKHFLGLPAYRRTRFVVVRSTASRGHEETALLAVEKESTDPVFSPITAVDLVAGPDECVLLRLPAVDCGVPTALARAAVDHAPGVRAVIVEGRYGHVNFIVNPEPLQITVLEVTPPHPAKLHDQVHRLLDVLDDLPPIDLRLAPVDFSDMAAQEPAAAYLLPCRGGGVDVPGARTAYLDQHPERDDWVLLGCERSQQIHTQFYGEPAPQVDFCPRMRARDETTGDGAILGKCCLLEEAHVREDGRVIVPWGASLSQIAEGLRELCAEWEPTWEPG